MRWIQNDFCKCSCLVLATKPGAISPVFYTVALLQGLKAERGAMTRNYRETWVNVTQGKTVLWLQILNNGVTWLWEQWVFRKSWNCSKSGYVITYLGTCKDNLCPIRINLYDFWVPFQLCFSRTIVTHLFKSLHSRVSNFHGFWSGSCAFCTNERGGGGGHKCPFIIRIWPAIPSPTP